LKPFILGFDTSEQTCLVVLSQGSELISFRQSTRPRQHTQLIWPMIHEVLDEASLSLAQLDAIACVSGPGGFTGVRVGCAVTQGLASGLRCPVIPINTLEALGYSCVNDSISEMSLIWAMMDARMGAVYTAVYEWADSGLKTFLLTQMKEYDALSVLLNQFDGSKTIYGVGSGWGRSEVSNCLSVLSKPVHIASIAPKAIARLASQKWFEQDYCDVISFKPLYLRHEVV
tara:strand:- start:1382 stop:2068 length:687 start_codon:yes stop_codon:yes gene_type:complete